MLKPAAGGLDVQRSRLGGELRRLDTEMSRLAAAIAQGGEVEALLAAVREREGLRKQLAADLRALEGIKAIDLPKKRAELRARLKDWQAVFRRQPVQARQILRRLLVGRLTLTPRIDKTGKHYDFKGVADRQRSMGAFRSWLARA